nr:putative ankyrin repeat protein RF_0381 [Lytechinus pictus]
MSTKVIGLISNAECVKYLLDKEADINAPDDVGYTPLIFAADKSVKDCAEILIARGADIDAKATSDYNVFHIAAETGQQECLRTLVDLVTMTQSGDRNNVDMVECILASSADVNKQNKTGNTALHIAASNGHLEILGILLESRADVNVQDGPLVDKQDAQGKTPLHLAVEGGFSPVMEALVEFGADLNIQTNNGETCLHLAVTIWGSSDKTVQDADGMEQVNKGKPL